MTNDERNPKSECRNALSCAIAAFVIRILRRSRLCWRGRFFSDSREIAFFAALHETFGHRLQLFPTRANSHGFLFGDMVVRRRARNHRQELGAFLNGLARSRPEVD